ncbi:septum formation family protein [Tersicoccus sp. MR15.9]|uniref:septum formation family protein n=1 Tax=Tersicoccus mangrovi TaxID=3121635 RepID=UPI002FE53868
MRARLLLPVGFIAASLLAGCGSTVTDPPRDGLGRVTESARTSAFAVTVGDCTSALDETGTTETIDIVPCDAPHAFEAYASHTMTEPTFPGMDAAAASADRECRTAYAEFVGVPLDRSQYTMIDLHPTERSWTEQTDRQVMCLAGRASGGITGSLKDTKQ